MPIPENPETRSIGGAIPEDLYWKFKAAQAARREKTTQALEIAIQLYLEAIPEDTTAGEEENNGSEL